MSGKGRSKKPKDEPPLSGLGGFLGGLADLVGKLGELADKGKELSGTGQLSDLGPGKQLKGVYGFNVKVGLGGEKLKVEPFGNIKRDRESGKTVVQEVREPMVDVFEEDDYVLVVAEIPGVGLDDIKLEARDDVLTIQAESGDKKYYKEVLLPKAFKREDMAISCNNGMLEIKCPR